jgi:acetyl-CoA synthetase
MDELIWRPDAERVDRSNIMRLIERAGVTSFAELQSRAESDPAWFWDLAVRDLGIEWYRPYSQVLDLSGGLPWARWFRGAQMNVAHECLDKHAGSERRDETAVLYEGEEGLVRRWSYRELLGESNRLANGLRALGIGRGDRVALFLPMIPETVAAIMAVAKLGAVFTPVFSGFAPQAVAARLNDCGARLLITADGFYRRGNAVDMKRAADEAASLCPTVERLVVVRRTGLATAWNPARDVWYHDLTAQASDRFETERLDPEERLMIIYTSGTTGRPKGAVHVHCGFPLKGTQDMAHCFDVKPGDTLMWFTDIGWMMGPWLIFGTLMLGATCFLYDGAPDFPDPGRIWSLVARHRISHLGLSPTVIRTLMPHGDHWPAAHDLSSLQVLGGTGEPWNPEPYLWYFDRVGGRRCPLINYSGGTEVSGGILCCVPIRPLKVCSFNCAVPGMAADVVDADGRSVTGAVGELVLRAPWPGMTRGFWNDPDRYLQTYWSRWEGVWAHGDWASVDPDGFWFIHGRSDDTIKLAGKRIGPAEYESVLVGHPAVAEAAAVGIPHAVKGEGALCFAVLRQGVEPTDQLRIDLKALIAREMGRPLVPEDIRFVGALPKTRNAKIMRRVIRSAWLGQSPGDLTALENPEAVEEIIRNRGEGTAP